jgi:group I intron endonuclease
MYGYIYKTTNLINGKVYIGQRKDKDVNLNYFGSGKRIKSAIKKYGLENFTVQEITFRPDKTSLDDCEIYWIAYFRQLLSQRNCYNLSKGGVSVFSGRKHSKETKKKMSLSHKGSHRSEETKKKMRLAQLGHTSWNKGKTGIYSEETKTKMSLAQKGKPKSVESKMKQSLSMKGKGHPQLEETKAKIGAANMGRQHTEEAKQKMSVSHKGKSTWNKGRCHSKESKQKMSIAHKGKRMSEEAKQKMSLAQKGRVFSKEHKTKLKAAWIIRKQKAQGTGSNYEE